MSQTITSPTVRFDKGQLQVILLPEKTDSEFWNSYSFLRKKYLQAVAYARAHPIIVENEKDAEKIRKILNKKFNYGMWAESWIGEEGKEYRLEDMKMEVEEVHICETCNKQGLRNCGYFDECGAWETKQVACLIEDDKQ